MKNTYWIVVGIFVVLWIWIIWEYLHPYEDDDYDEDDYDDNGDRKPNT